MSMEYSGSSGSGGGQDETVASETFHIYVLSFAYGCLIFLLVVHIIWRWQWKRTELAHLKSHYPGDKSFHCKTMRKVLKNDFTTLQRLHASPRARLIKPDHSPDQFGPTGEIRVPSHWYRMNVFDEAADFVSQNAYIVEDPLQVSPQDTSTLPLPMFVSRLQESGLVDSVAECGDRCCQLYEFARYKDGVFMESHWDDFRSSLKELRTQLSTSTKKKDRIHPTTRVLHRDHLAMVSPSSEIVIGFGKHDPLQQTTSNDPLIEASGESVVRSCQLKDTEDVHGVHEALGSITPSRARSKKGASLELSPLVRDSDSVDSLDITAFTNLETNV